MSKEILEKNLKAMEKWYVEFAEDIRNQKYKKDKLTVESRLSEDNQLIYYVTKDNRSLYLNGKRNVKKPLEIWKNRLGKMPKGTPVVLLGLGSGLYLKELIAATEDAVKVVVYEPSMTIFLKTLEEVDLSREIESRPIAFIVEGVTEEVFENVVRKLIGLETVEFLKQEIHPNYQELFPKKILERLKQVDMRVRDIFMNENTGVSFSTHLARNQMQNMKYLCEGYNTKKLWQAISSDVPAILVAAGPSLNKNIHYLKEAKNKAFILAVDTALKPLLREGIIPDAFVTIDAAKPLHLVENEEVKKIPVVAPIVANSDILDQHIGKKIFYADGHGLPILAYQSIEKEFPSVLTGGSVACSGFSLLHKMGFSTIILVGQDLAYTDNKSHADGTFQEVMPETDTGRMRMVKGNYQDKVPTAEDLNVFLEWFADYIKNIRVHAEVRVINATAGGAYIEGTELMSLDEAIKECCGKEVDFQAQIDRMESDFTLEERQKVVDYIHKTAKEFGAILKIAKELNTTYYKIKKMCNSGNIEKKGYLKLLKKVKKLSKKCEEYVMYELVNSTMVAANYFVRSESLYEGDTLQEGIAIAEQGMKYTKILIQCVEILSEFSKETLEKIE